MSDDWRPIATAPRDGSILILYLGEDIERTYVSPKEAARYCLGFFEVADPEWGRRGEWLSIESAEETWGYGSELTGPMTDTSCIPCKPTHWMPLPEPPK
jgi:hypothetical protein